jgi:hypothetical protein
MRAKVRARNAVVSWGLGMVKLLALVSTESQNLLFEITT